MEKALLLATAISLATTACAQQATPAKVNPDQISTAAVSSQGQGSALTAEQVVGIMTMISIFAILYGTLVGQLPAPVPVLVR